MHCRWCILKKGLLFIFKSQSTLCNNYENNETYHPIETNRRNTIIASSYDSHWRCMHSMLTTHFKLTCSYERGRHIICLDACKIKALVNEMYPSRNTLMMVILIVCFSFAQFTLRRMPVQISTHILFMNSYISSRQPPCVVPTFDHRSTGGNISNTWVMGSGRMQAGNRKYSVMDAAAVRHQGKECTLCDQHKGWSSYNLNGNSQWYQCDGLGIRLGPTHWHQVSFPLRINVLLI